MSLDATDRPGQRAMPFVRSFLRSYLTGVGFNTRGMQNLGLVFAMQPGLKAIHPEPRALRAALKRYARHYQSHPFWLPCLVGIHLNVEQTIAAGRFPPRMLGKVKDTTAYTLSALGDSVFAGGLLIFWALLTICLLLTDQRLAALLLGAGLFLGLQAFRAYVFVGGLRHGFRFLDRLRRWDLINWGGRLKCLNAGLLLWLWVLIWPRPFAWWEWLLGVAGLIVFGRFVRTGLFTRILAAAVLVWLLAGFDRVALWLHAALNL